MRRIALLGAAAVLGAAADDAGRSWWAHVEYLASDAMRGRNAGSAEHRKAAEYVAARLEDAGLKPCLAEGFLQPVNLTEVSLDEGASRLEIVRGGEAEQVRLGSTAMFSTRVDLAAKLEAGAVFVGYGLRIPEHGWDDYRGLDLKGKVAVTITGSPSHIPGPVRAHYSAAAERSAALGAVGAVGSLSIPNPKTADVPWARSLVSRLTPSMRLSDATLSESGGLRFSASYNPEEAAALFAGTPHKLADLLALATAGKELPRFPLGFALRARTKTATRQTASENVCGWIPGLTKETVVLTAHLDHIGVTPPVNGDAINNGAMDNASGIATLIEVARAMGRGERPRRGIVFAAVTAEEKGLLGSRYFARRFPRELGVPVANINFDMFLPIHAMKKVMVLGLDESTLREPLQAVAAGLGLALQSDPEPARNRFIRSDQYNFIRRGVPAVALKVGYDAGTPEAAMQKKWTAERYHAPRDDLAQPVELGAAVLFNRVVEGLARQVAADPEAPRWLEGSFFRRFAGPR